MSSSVSKALKLTGGEEAVETAQFVEIVDKLFDCLNVSSVSKGRYQKKAFIQPYRKQDDFRINVSNHFVKTRSLLTIFMFLFSFYVMTCFHILINGKEVLLHEVVFQKSNGTLWFYPGSHDME